MNTFEMLILLLFIITTISYTESWRTGSVTFYGNKKFNDDPYTLLDGTCSCYKAKKYGICYANWCFDNIEEPYMVGAINTKGISNTRLCGKCVVMKCKAGRYRGYVWSEFGNENVCYNMSKTIIIQITDSCPEYHDNPSNKKFCNSRIHHFDLSFWAFKKLAPSRFGVIDIEFRFVKCPHKITQAFGVKSSYCCNMTQVHTCLHPL